MIRESVSGVRGVSYHRYQCLLWGLGQVSGHLLPYATVQNVQSAKVHDSCTLYIHSPIVSPQNTIITIITLIA